MVTKEKKQEIVKKFGGTVKNTGSSAVQIAILTEEIEDLKKHFETNKKDKHSKKGFLAKIEKRKKLLTFLKNDNFEEYSKTIKALGLRK